MAAGIADPAIPAAGMTTRVVKGSLWTLLGQVAPLAVSLAATPFTIRLLGAEGYGVFILVGLIPAYLAFADLGMSLASTRFASEAFGRGDRKEEAAVIRTAVAVALAGGVPVALGLIIFAPQVISLFAVPEILFTEAEAALRISSVTFVVYILCSILNTPQLARLRMDLNTLINAGTRIAGLIATPVALYLGFGIAGAAAVLLAAMSLNLAGHIFFSGRLLPELFGLGISREKLRPLLIFGGGLVVSSIAAVALSNAEKGILAAVVSSSSLAHYTVAFTAATMMT
ncbi:MAG TPA: oligosaccharide flippase family protein, partial [Pyrinomonadaceae bacterium]|nr:oligosaccharide flippase family protein [Pyrinomonadaceae bacterium]